jgi:hypothetical protein
MRTHVECTGVPKQSIGEVVAWAQQQDGVALDDIEEIEEAGCMRWGLCEKPAQAARAPAQDGDWW